jgi:hypothetical protein
VRLACLGVALEMMIAALEGDAAAGSG